MSVLSFFDIQCFGNHSQGSKSKLNMVEETILPAGCQIDRSAENLRVTVSKKKQDTGIDFAEKGFGNDYSFKDNCIKENSSSQKHIDGLLNGQHAAEGSSPTINGLHKPNVEEEPRNNLVTNADYSFTGSIWSEERQSSGTIEEEGSSITESHSHQFIEHGICHEHKQTGLFTPELSKSNDCFAPAEDDQNDKINKTNDGVNSRFTTDYMQSDDTASHEDSEGHPLDHHELSSLALGRDLGQGNLIDKQKNIIMPRNNNLIVEKMENMVQNKDQEEQKGLLENGHLEQAVALWIKWRGKWKTGIQCPRADCSSAALRAKPTHERKKYIPVFFPRSKTYAWTDMLLVRPIGESPEPLLHGTHRKWRKLVRNLSIPRRYVIQKLGVAMLNTSDQLHIETVVDDARKATTWKEFAREVSQCKDYSDLGRMLIKLKSLILPSFLDHNWLESSSPSWIKRCQDAQSAESIEILTQELTNFILWTNVDDLWSAPVQPELGPEWKSWKQEAMKLFLTSNLAASASGSETNNCSNSLVAGYQISNKRLKLEAQRLDSFVPHSTFKTISEINTLGSDATNLNGSNLDARLSCQLPMVEPHSMVVASEFSSLSSKLSENAIEVKDLTSTSAVVEIDRNGSAGSQVESEKRYGSRQCSAIVPSKGRQCGRWANDGDIFCCVHLSAHSAQNLSQVPQKLPMETPMCAGLTTDGRKCKHHARYGSMFCKKHHIQGCHDSLNSKSLLDSSEHILKLDHIENPDINFCRSNISNKLALQKVQTTQENLIPVMVGETLDEKNCLMNDSELSGAFTVPTRTAEDMPRCIGNYCYDDPDQCLEYAKRYSLYCDNHLPKFLKHAENDKSRYVSKEVFTTLLKNCATRKQKFCLHQSCELLYGFLKNSLSHQKPVSRSELTAWILSEAAKDMALGECLLKLISSERERLSRIWGFNAADDNHLLTLKTDSTSTVAQSKTQFSEQCVECKICCQPFTDDGMLGMHWTEVHKKEARWLFRGFACAVCMEPFTNKKVLEAHVKEGHGVELLDHSIIFRCMSCNSHVASAEELWHHVISFHIEDFKLPDFTQQPLDQAVQLKVEKPSCSHDVSESPDSQKLTCRFCGLKFDLLPDLGRHHQVAHMNSARHFPPKSGKYHLKQGRHSYPSFKKNFGASFRLKNQTKVGLQQHFSTSRLHLSEERLQVQPSESSVFGKLLDSQCLEVAGALFSESKETKPPPSNLELLSLAQSCCCRTCLEATLQMNYGILPETVYLKALKLCSELNIQVDWHIEGFVCTKGCKPLNNPVSLAPLKLLEDFHVDSPLSMIGPFKEASWEMDESHYIINQEQIDCELKPIQTIICEDVSFGRERIPIACVIDENLKGSLYLTPGNVLPGQEFSDCRPWQGFEYVTKRLINPSVDFDSESSQLGCACLGSCYPDNCDHVYLFDNDYEDAVDINGLRMHGRFAYDDRGRIILEHGHVVYECNSECKCDMSCHNRVLQKGVQVKLEIFRTEKKGWAVRAGEDILRGTFICEYIGEVLKVEAAEKSGERFYSGCSYFYDINAHIDGARGLSEGTIPCIIDARNYGNVSRFINHSCSPNLTSYLVLVESMDCQLSHIGLYASCDIALGEELAFDYRYELVPGEGQSCHCGAPNCRGRLY